MKPSDVISNEFFQPIAAGVRIGHIHLKVEDIDRSLVFYHDVLGFEITKRIGEIAVFLSAGGYHHHIGLHTWSSAGAYTPPPGMKGLFHLAILYPTRALLADALRRVRNAGIPIEDSSDHGVSEAIYLRDPDQNSVELYWDRPRKDWPLDEDGALTMHFDPLDLDDLLKE